MEVEIYLSLFHTKKKSKPTLEILNTTGSIYSW